MNVLRRIAMGIAGVAGVALVLALAAPRAAHAVASALVTISNTAANPVPVQSVDDHALHSFELSADCGFVGTSVCVAELAPFPAGTTAVVQDVSGLCTLGGGSAPAPPPFEISLDEGSNGPPEIPVSVPLFTTFQAANNLATTTYVYGRQITIYAVNTSSVQQQLRLDVTLLANAVGGICTVQIAGYYVPNGL